MTPSGLDSESMWLTWVLPSLAVILIVVVIVAFLLRREEPQTTTRFNPYLAKSQSVTTRENGPATTVTTRPQTLVLAEVLKSLAPTLNDDERRVMDEMVKAGGEVLQSDLPRTTSFSKATVSKAIHGLETRGIVLRERNKWTYWCKVNPRLIERTLQELSELQEPTPITA